MGYKRTTYTLVFEDPRLEGLEVRARGASIEEVSGVMAVADLADMPDNPTAEDLRKIEPLFRVFIGCPPVCEQQHRARGGRCYPGKVLSWNLEEDDGTPVPVSHESFQGEEFAFQVGTAMAWLDAVLGTPGPLDAGSSSGGPSVEASIPMETLSLGLLSSPEPSLT